MPIARSAIFDTGWAVFVQAPHRLTWSQANGRRDTCRAFAAKEIRTAQAGRKAIHSRLHHRVRPGHLHCKRPGIGKRTIGIIIETERLWR